jgi:hypothetical protein
MFLGRYQLGQWVFAPVLCTNADRRPSAPDAAPRLTVYDPAELAVYDRELAALDQGAATGLFRASVFLGAGFSPGTYRCLWRWAVAGTPGAQEGSFTVLEGGGSSGQVIAMTEYRRPAAQHVVNRRDGGALVKGKNPRRSR